MSRCGLVELEGGRRGTAGAKGHLHPGEAGRIADRSVVATCLNKPFEDCRWRAPVQIGSCSLEAEEFRGRHQKNHRWPPSLGDDGAGHRQAGEAAGRAVRGFHQLTARNSAPVRKPMILAIYELLPVARSPTERVT